MDSDSNVAASGKWRDLTAAGGIAMTPQDPTFRRVNTILRLSGIQSTSNICPGAKRVSIVG